VTEWASVGGCSECSITGELCVSCLALKRALEAKPTRPLSIEWGQAQDCPGEAKLVLLGLLRKVDWESGFSQLDLPSIAQASGLEASTSEHAAHWACERMRLLVKTGWLETRPELPSDVPWLLRWLSRKTKTPEGIVWIRVKSPDQAPVWTGPLAA
jgi:hypothetical protein